VPEALDLADDRRPARRAATLTLLDILSREAPFPGAARVGVTGAPGAGKSTLLDALVRTLRPRGETVAIVAVDPSSQRSGGALLGDRVRVRSGANDPGVFIRSMAARDRLGGLADATRAAVEILSVAFDRVFVETVGIGQSEGEIAALADTLLYVASPGSGDLLQFMKAGVLELPDVFVVNKADQGAAAERSASELESGLGLGERAGAPGWTAPVVLTSARDGSGVEELLEVLDRHRKTLAETGERDARRRRGRDRYVAEQLRARYGSFGIDALGGDDALRERIAAEPEASGFRLAQALGREIEDALGKPR
jgi:LAO/AO transport system kinase